MPIFGRFLVNGVPRHAEVDGGTAYLIDDLFGGARRTGESIAIEGAKVLAPVAPPKLFAIGLNYADHAKESNQDVPEWPLMWFKANTAVIAHRETVELVHPDHRTDHECELTIVIGRQCRAVAEAEAHRYIFGYTLGQD